MRTKAACDARLCLFADNMSHVSSNSSLPSQLLACACGHEARRHSQLADEKRDALRAKECSGLVSVCVWPSRVQQTTAEEDGMQRIGNTAAESEMSSLQVHSFTHEERVTDRGGASCTAPLLPKGSFSQLFVPDGRLIVRNLWGD